jgi:ABC-2 type transport system ATP-binding protein
MSLVVNQVVKQYGNQRAVNGISFSVQPGEIVGFLGPNGAGKSTTMKIATGYIPPTSGGVRVLDIAVQEKPIQAQKHIGYLPEHNPLYLEAYVHEYLHFVAGIQGVNRKNRASRVKEVVKLCGLEREQNKRIAALSKGYRQRVGLAQALVHDPNVLILDEPTTGLDPNQILEIREVIRGIRANKTVVFSTHIMQEVQALCDRVVIINQGNIVADSPLAKLQNSDSSRIVKVSFDKPIAADSFLALSSIQEVQPLTNQSFKLFTSNESLAKKELIQYVASNDLPLASMGTEENSLEKIFRELTLNSSAEEVISA